LFSQSGGGWIHALRALRRTPTFTGTAILILGLGVGMATAMLSVFDAALLQPLPIRDQNRVIVAWPVGKGGTEFPLFAEEYERLRDNSTTMEGVAGFAHWGAVHTPFSIGDQSLQLRQAQVSPNFFSVLGTSPALGRLLQPGDRMDGSTPVMVISHATWRRLFAGERAVIGKQLKWLPTGTSFTIVGVAPPGLDYPIGTDVWVPAWPGQPLDVIGRLKPSATPAAAQAELLTVVLEWRQRTGNNSLESAFARELPAMIYGDVRPAILVMTAAAGLLLLIACTNVGNLLLLRAAGRGREVAIRRALGASRWDIFRQIFSESVVLGLLGGTLGLTLALGLLRGFVALAPDDLPRMEAIRLAGTPLLVAFAVTFATVMLTGLAPLLSTGRADIDAPLLRQDNRSGTESRTRRRIRQLLVSGQVALALVVLAGASLVTRSLIRLETLSFGYDRDQLSIVQLVPPPLADTSYVP